MIDGSKTSKSTFNFDKIYGQQAQNRDIYADSCKEIIDRVIKGFNGKAKKFFRFL